MRAFAVAGVAGAATGALLYFLARNQMKASLEREADRYAQIAATRAAERHLATYYGLTPDRIRGLERLGRQLGMG